MEVFIVKSKEIEGRADSFYYRPEFIKTIEKIKKSNFKNTTLGQIISSLSGGATPKVEENFYTDQENGVPFLRVQNITEEGIDLKDVKYIKREVHDGMLNRSQLNKDDLVFTITGRIGSVAVVPENFEGNINQHSVRFHLKESFEDIKISPQYIAIFLNTHTAKTIALRNTTGGTRPALDYIALKSLPILLPDTKTQQKIVRLMDYAYAEKRKKEDEAKRLTDSIEDYLVSELELNFTSSQRRCFTIRFSSVAGRLDPLFYSQDVFSFLDKSKYPAKSLGESTVYLKTGFAAGKQDQDSSSGGIVQIRPTNMGENGSLKFDRNIYIEKGEASKYSGDLLQKGEVLFNNTNSQDLVGKSAFLDLDDRFFCSNHVTRIKTDDEVVPEYLALLLNVYQKNKVFYNICTNWNNQSGVNINLLKTVKIPVPPISVQSRIASEVRSRLDRAGSLRREASEVLEEARRVVEALILGN